MDIVERIRAGGLSKYEREAANEIERLRKKSEEDEELKAKAAEMIEQLRLRNDRLRATLKMVTSKSHSTIYEI